MVNMATLGACESADWNTPDDFLEPVYAFAAPDGIGVDPCSNWTARVKARVRWSDWWGDDGLLYSWRVHRGVVFVNFPYSRTTSPKWAKKIVTESRLGSEIIALAPARTETRWGQELLAAADAVCFVSGRIDFVPAEPNDGTSDNPTFPSMVLYFGPRAARFKEVFSQIGCVYFPSPNRPVPKAGASPKKKGREEMPVEISSRTCAKLFARYDQLQAEMVAVRRAERRDKVELDLALATRTD